MNVEEPKKLEIGELIENYSHDMGISEQNLDLEVEDERPGLGIEIIVTSGIIGNND